MFFSESGKLLLTAGLDESIRVWHARTLHLVDVLHHDALHPVTRSVPGRYRRTSSQPLPAALPWRPMSRSSPTARSTRRCGCGRSRPAPSSAARSTPPARRFNSHRWPCCFECCTAGCARARAGDPVAARGPDWHEGSQEQAAQQQVRLLPAVCRPACGGAPCAARAHPHGAAAAAAVAHRPHGSGGGGVLRAKRPRALLGFARQKLPALVRRRWFAVIVLADGG